MELYIIVCMRPPTITTRRQNEKREVLHIYTRVSTVSQADKGTSLVEQRDAGIKRSKELGFSYKVWNEGGKSSSHDDLANRPILDDLLRQVDKGFIKHLYVWNTDRLSRNLMTWGMIRTSLIRNDVHLHTPTGEQILSDEVTNMVIGILSEVSQYDNRLRTQRTRLGKLRRVKDNFWMGGPPPFGYSLKDHKLVVNKSESDWVKRIFEWYAGGFSNLQIRNELLKNGVLTKRGNAVWSLGSIVALLDNTHYVGHYTYRDKKEGGEIECTCPRLISETLFQKVQQLKKQRSYGNSSQGRVTGEVRKHSYLLTTLLRCGHCGSLYYGNKKPHSKQLSYYSCSQKTNKFRDTKKKPLCSTYRNVNIETTDEKVWGLVVDVISNSVLFKEGIKQQVFNDQRPLSSPTEKKKILRQIETLNKDLELIEEVIVNRQTESLILDVKGEKDPTSLRVLENLKKKRSNLQLEVEELTKRVEGETQSKLWIDWLKEFRLKLDKLDELSTEEKKRFLTGIVKEITLTQVDKQTHNIEVEFLFPYVGDKLAPKKNHGKSVGYKIIEGVTTKKVTTNLLKKYLQTST